MGRVLFGKFCFREIFIDVLWGLEKNVYSSKVYYIKCLYFGIL